MKPFYLTTTLPYVNADPHIGFALEIVQADVVARYHELLGDEVFFNTGTDEHGVKIFRNAEKEGVEVQAYADKYASRFKELLTVLNIWPDVTFIRTTDERHMASAQEMWKRCEAKGDIYKKNYKIKYCVGCELEKTDSELEDGKCGIHPTYEIELIDEENYFFKFSKYQQPLLDLYKKYEDFVMPAHRLNEIRSFVERGLEDFSISRVKEKMPWGVPVPGDDTQVMYVWFDALTNYISTLGWPENTERFEKFWGTKRAPNAIQVAGKDNVRQQSAMWQAMLMSADLTTSRQVFIHGFISSEGQKMSKSIGNVVDPFVVVEKYGVDAVRYYLIGALPSAEDGDWSVERFEQYYTAHLANGIGNLTSRILTMLEKYSDGKVPEGAESHTVSGFWKVYDEHLATYQFDRVVEHVQGYITKLDGLITHTKPWEKANAGEDITDLLYTHAESLRHIALSLLPMIPGSAEKILSSLGVKSTEYNREWGGLKAGTQVKKGESLFPRLS